MKKIGLVLGALTILALLSGVALATCEDDCDGPFQTCLNICRQTTEADSAEAGKCANHCMKGRGGCLKRCEAQNQKSDNTTDCTKGYLLAAGDFVAEDNNIVLADNCIEKDLQCTLNGTPCCAPYECKGKFPNTYCQEK
jgi:hypothetical protein